MIVMNDGIKTRNLYNFEDVYFKNTFFSRDLSMNILRKQAFRVWKIFGKNKEFPKIVADRGTFYNGRYLSYSQGNDIRLARNQRNIITLMHEITHALGFEFHNKKFVDMEFSILEHMFKKNRGELELTAGLFGVER